MRIPKRAALRLALAGWLGLAGLSLVAAPASAATPAAPEKVFPDSVVFFAKIQNAAAPARGVPTNSVRSTLERSGAEAAPGGYFLTDGRARQLVEESRRPDAA